MLDLMEEAEAAGKKVLINWYYDGENPRALDLAEEFAEDVDVPFHIIPISMFCKKIRTDTEYWQQIESYFAEHIEVMFSHGICPDCMKEKYGEFLARRND
jgi:hypothetical protein